MGKLLKMRLIVLIRITLLFESFVLSFDDLIPSNSFNSNKVERIILPEYLK